jgi:heterodisulfide reductase subunit C
VSGEKASAVASSSKSSVPLRVDASFKREVMKQHDGATLKVCFQCGTCTSSCPAARFSDSYRPRTILSMAQLGLKDQVLSSTALWLCMACFTCSDRCPQGVEVASVLRVLRNLAVENGFVPQVFIELNSSIKDTGYAYRIPELRQKKRAEAGLPPLPKANCKDVSKLLELACRGKMLKK